MVKKILMISAFPLTILFVGIAGIILYKRTIREKSWFDGLHLEFDSVDCPHTKTIPYEKTFGLSFKRKEKRVKTVVFNKSEVRKDVTFLLLCDECGKRRFFHLIETPEVKAYSKHKTLYLLGTFGAIFVVYGIIVAPILTLITKLFNL
ncbi:hypothetical protein QT716_11285 [Sporosarcina aquimarina]|uniref:DUF3592 domain-containing protein n=1 Tax=Sporosarcina aquimarina TaxID=114975 RepID=A0ABU4G0X4_9BACL|nr:hypothetical protein [Sporosarcina aquimarina]